jgi:hypothetical protein
MVILNLCQVLVLQKCFWKNGEGVPDGVLGGYCRGTAMVRSTCRVLPKEMRWSCVIDLDL